MIEAWGEAQCVVTKEEREARDGWRKEMLRQGRWVTRVRSGDVEDLDVAPHLAGRSGGR